MMQSAQNTEVYVKITQASTAVVPQASSEDFVRLTKEKLEQISNLIQTSCTALAERVRSLPGAPAEITMEFGVDVGGEAGIPFVTKGTINANFKVSALWKLDRSHETETTKGQ